MEHMMRLIPCEVLGNELTKSALGMILGVVELWLFLVSYVIGKGLKPTASSRAILVESAEHRRFRVPLALRMDLPDLAIVIDFFA